MNTCQKIYLPFKRLIGIIGSFVGIIFCFVFLWWWVFIINFIATKGHPLFISKRIGQNGKEFGLLKFRSMKIDADPDMVANDSKVDNSITKFGSFLRKSSIDETLQLFNILIGQMSFIGPRPLIYAGADTITINKRKENGSINLKPGLSGYAQLHSRSNLDYLKKAELDFYYYKHLSFLLDLKIFVKTIFGVFGTNRGK